MNQPLARLTILALDHDAKAFDGFYSILAELGDLHVYPTLDQLLSDHDNYADRVILLDVVALQRAPTALVAYLVEHRSQLALGLITDRDADEYIFDLRRWGILNVGIKTEPHKRPELAAFVESLRDRASAFGLAHHLSDSLEILKLYVKTIAEKNAAVEEVINHFATANFDIHDLYDVRLILEESLNNSFYHAFRNEAGGEKYTINTFKSLAAGEEVTIEFGTSATTAGFSVTDNAGSLSVRTVLGKFERQFNREGLFDVSGRGLYLSRMLSTSYIINIEPHNRTQVIALFDDRRRSGRPKPFNVNFVGSDDFEEWRLDSELD